MWQNIPRVKYFIGLSILISSLFSCGYFMSGTWQDDNENWNRVYHYDLPDSVEIIHSFYWRSAHWTLEQEYFFQLKYDEEIINSFLSKGGMKLHEDNIEPLLRYFNDKPSWFAPLDNDRYDIFIEEGLGNFKLFVDKDKNYIFWSDYQI